MGAAVAGAMAGAELVAKQDMHAALRDLEQRLTIRLGGMSVGAVVAAVRFPAH